MQARFLSKCIFLSVSKIHHGYRRTDEEIIGAAKRNGLKPIVHEDYAFLTEFKRSWLVRNLIKHVPYTSILFSAIGKSIPYIRMFHLEKFTR